MALNVSSKWKENIKSQFRYPGYLKVLLALVPDEIREGTAVNTFHTDEMSSPVQLIDGVAEAREPFATFEKNRWRGDGLQSSYVIGFFSPFAEGRLPGIL